MIETSCAHCGKPLHLEVTDDLRMRVLDEGARPMVFAPMVDFAKLGDPSIIDAF